MVAAGLLSEADALASPQAHVVTGWVGADLSDAAPHVTRFEPPGPGAVLLCSDGLWNYQPEAAKLAALALPQALTDPLGAAAELVSFALERGGMDNVTVVLAPFPPLSPLPPGPPPVPAGLTDPIPRRTPPMSQPDFTVDIYQNEYLPEGGAGRQRHRHGDLPGHRRRRRRRRTPAARRSSSSTAPGR